MNKEKSDNKFLLIGYKFMPELHLYQAKIGKYSAYGPFTKHQERINLFMKNFCKNQKSHLCKNQSW